MIRNGFAELIQIEIEFQARDIIHKYELSYDIADDSNFSSKIYVARIVADEEGNQSIAFEE